VVEEVIPHDSGTATRITNYYVRFVGLVHRDTILPDGTRWTGRLKDQ
jgi:hypothetical protein